MQRFRAPQRAPSLLKGATRAKFGTGLFGEGFGLSTLSPQLPPDFPFLPPLPSLAQTDGGDLPAPHRLFLADVLGRTPMRERVEAAVGGERLAVQVRAMWAGGEGAGAVGRGGGVGEVVARAPAASAWPIF